MGFLINENEVKADTKIFCFNDGGRTSIGKPSEGMDCIIFTYVSLPQCIKLE